MAVTVSSRMLNEIGQAKSVPGLGDKVDALITAVREIIDDHATTKTTVDAARTAILELILDHATFKTAADEVDTLIEELAVDHATFITVVADVKALVNQLRAVALSQIHGNPDFVRNANFDTANNLAIYYTNAGTMKTLAANTNFDTGTAQVITANKWSAALLSISAAGAGVVTWSATLDAATEAAAIAALPALPAGNTPAGYVTVLTGSGVTWTAGTEALHGGTGGTPATTTNYYNHINPNAAQIAAAVSS